MTDRRSSSHAHNLLIVFLVLLVAAFVAEHIYLLVMNDRNPLTVDPPAVIHPKSEKP